MRVLAIDYGRRFIGLALTDSLGSSSIISPLETLRVRGLGEALEGLDRVCREYRASHLVFGLPLFKDRREGNLSKEIRQLASRLSQKTGIERVSFVDESLTSFIAGRSLSDLKRKRRREVENSLAAVLILEQFLSRPKGKDQQYQTDD